MKIGMRGWVLGLGVAILSASSLPAVPNRSDETKPAGERSDAEALAEKIDRIIEAEWVAKGVKQAPIVDDAEFMRRIYLDLTGRIPRVSEVHAFLSDKSPDRRAKLVENLLDSPRYVFHFGNTIRSLLVPPNSNQQFAFFQPGFKSWLDTQVQENVPYDKMIREILTVSMIAGFNPGLRGNNNGVSPVAYYQANEFKPENLAASTSRLFLGVRLECAQCHDHPFARWKRENFWGFAAFFAGVPSQGEEEAIQTPRVPPTRRELTIPGTSKVVKAAHLDGSPPAWRPRADSREVLADWVTAPENPYFARAVVNRVWARFFGVGLVEPVDDLDLDAAPEFGALLDELAGEFRSHGYDLKSLIRVLTATRAYNLSSAAERPAESAAATFSVMPVRGLSAGQLFDSLTQATGADGAEARARFLDLFATRDERPAEAQTSILQALTMMNGSYIAGATSPVTGDVLGAIAKAPFLDTPGRIETLYLATLTRRPRPDELALLVRYVDRREGADDQANALADVFWAILNGPEFHLNH